MKTTSREEKEASVTYARIQVLECLSLYNERIVSPRSYLKYKPNVFFVLICFTLLLIFLFFGDNSGYVNDRVLLHMEQTFLCCCVVYFTREMVRYREYTNNAFTIYAYPVLAADYAASYHQLPIPIDAIVKDDTLLNTLFDEIYESRKAVYTQQLCISAIKHLKNMK